MSTRPLARFDQLQDALASLSDTARRSFALNCAQHTLPFYEAWSTSEDWGSPDLFADVLSKIAQGLQTPNYDFEQLANAIPTVEANIPDADDFIDASPSGAMDAGVSVLYALHCAIDGSVESAFTAGYSSITVFDITSTAFDDSPQDDLATRDLAPEAIAEWERQMQLVKTLDEST